MLQYIPYSSLAVITATCNRPKCLERCLEQFTVARKQFSDVQLIVVDESDNDDSQHVIANFPVTVSVRQQKMGLWGAYGKDVGISLAQSEYVCFWDDDNQYYPNALKDLYETANGYDIGIVQTVLGQAGILIPDKWNGTFELRNIDSMCLCVKRSLAATKKWSDHKHRGTDFAWINKLAKLTTDINFRECVIGQHTCNRYQTSDFVTPTGFWVTNNYRDFFDEALINALVPMFQGRTVIDLGCGHGRYVQYLNNINIKCIGIDGNPNVQKLGGPQCKIFDLSAKLPSKFVADWVISFEVGEHIPKQYEKTFLKNIADSCKIGAVISWAVPGQGGDGHVNERPNSYIENQMASLGFLRDISFENYLRSVSTVDYFKNDLMVFRVDTHSTPPK